MSTKRDKELARAKWERQQVRRTAKAQRQTVIKRGVLAGLVVVGIAVYAIANKPASTPVAAPPKASSTATTDAAAGCNTTGPIKTTAKQYASAPISGASAKTLDLNTNCGRISIALDPKAPTTTNVMTHLAKDKYFDMTACHRLTTSGIYVLQCGDPTGSGSGGPGFKFADENLPKATGGTANYNRGTIAMANSGPGTNGSQFFIVYNTSPLPPNYSVWGQVTSGLEVVDRIAAAGVKGGATDGKPNANVVIERAVAQ
jgi:peptidyl-prolyl cis-trans isomerase B (cyclophilin B)